MTESEKVISENIKHVSDMSDQTFETPAIENTKTAAISELLSENEMKIPTLETSLDKTDVNTTGRIETVDILLEEDEEEKTNNEHEKRKESEQTQMKQGSDLDNSYVDD